MKKDQNFTNLITLKKYSNFKEAEKYNFLLANAFYTKPNKEKLDTRYSEIKDTKTTWLLNEYYKINPIFISAITSYFLKYPIDITPITDKIKIELSQSLDRTETIKNWHKKHSKIITKSHVNPLIFFQDNKINKQKLNSYIKEHFNSPDCDCLHLRIIETYMISDIALNLYKIPFFKELIQVISSMYVLHFLKEQRQDNQEEKSKTKSEQLTTRQAVMLIEEIYRIDNWSELPATRKSIVISKLIGKNSSNIRKVYSELEKKASDATSNFNDDTQTVFKLLKTNKLI